MDPETEARLLGAAREAREHAYCPYSNFSVGAAVLAGSGRVYHGCNVENASYGLTICAERSAVAAAVTAGERRILAVAVAAGEAGDAVWPCGACRQVLREFGDDMAVVSVNAGGEISRSSLAELLPRAFGPANLNLGPA